MLSSQSDRRRRQQPPRRPPSRGRPREGRAPRGRGGRAAPPSWWWQQRRRAAVPAASASVSPPVCPLCWCFTPAQRWDVGQTPQAGDSGGDAPSPYLLHQEHFCCCRIAASKSHDCTSTAERTCCHCHAQLRCDADAQLEKPWAT